MEARARGQREQRAKGKEEKEGVGERRLEEVCSEAGVNVHSVASSGPFWVVGLRFLLVAQPGGGLFAFCPTIQRPGGRRKEGQLARS